MKEYEEKKNSVALLQTSFVNFWREREYLQTALRTKSY